MSDADDSGTTEPRDRRARALAYLLAPISVAGCIGLRFLVGPVLHDRGRMITFTLAVAISALVGGSGPGLLATTLGMIAGILLFMHPASLIFHSPESALAILFLINSLVMCWLSGSRDRAARAARSLNRQLERRVAERTAMAEQKTLALEKYQVQLRSLASELTLAEQRERRRIAVELHDDIAHLLVMCKLKLSSLTPDATESAPNAEAVQQIKQALDEAIGYTRSLIFRLSPPILYELGLEAAVEWLAAQFQSRHGLTVEARDDRQPKPLGEDVRVALFHAIRELLFNVVKHAHSNRALVLLARSDDRIQVTVQDDGAGFNTRSLEVDAPQAGGLGLFGIRERIDLLGGTVQVVSAAGRGTRVILTAPLTEEAGADSQSLPLVSDRHSASTDRVQSDNRVLPGKSHG